MIRDIVAGDKEQILRLVEMFFKERLEQSGVTYSPEHADVHFHTFLNTPGILALCAEENGRIVGMIAGVASAIIFAKELAMQEMVWYVEPTSRKCGLHLLREFEKRSTELGVHYVMMIGMSGDPIISLYSRLGYTETQNVFMKRLE